MGFSLVKVTLRGDLWESPLPSSLYAFYKICHMISVELDKSPF